MPRRPRSCLAALLTLALVLALGGCRSTIRRQAAGCLDIGQGDCRRTYHYLVYRPPCHADKARHPGRWPLLLYLPGFLSWGHDVSKLGSGDPPGEIEAGRDFPMVVMTPMTPDFLQRWHSHQLIALIDHAIATYDVDPSRVYVSGASLGGVAIWDLIQDYPHRIAAAAPVCGCGKVRNIRGASTVPVWGFHGALDFVVGLPFHKRMADAHRAAGGDTRFTIYPLGMHWIWAQTYARQDLYDWMLAQRKGATPSGSRGRATSPASARAYARGSAEIPRTTRRRGSGRATR